jgi:dTDP-4-amino-4,6-dideoxygalactose transaminase
VIIPALTFIATANAARHLGAEVHFADSSRQTLGLDPDALKDWLSFIAEKSASGIRNRLTGRRISSVVPMHTFGHPSEMDRLLALAKDYKLLVIEDSAESLGSYYNGRHTGTFGLLGTLSFNGNKIITTGGGGAILTNDNRLADYAKHLVTTAKIPHSWEFNHDEVGYNFRMPNINAALGCAQLEKLPEALISKRRLHDLYSRAFSEISQLKLMTEPIGCKSNYWLQTLILNAKDLNLRDRILETTNQSGLATRPAWTLLSKLRPYQFSPSAPLPVAKTLAQQIINVPSSAGLV